MKEKIELFAKGVFAYERPELITSVGNISISVEMGKVFRGSFNVSSSAGKSFKGLVYSTSTLLSFDSDMFFSTENIINYSFDARHLDIGDSVKGRITIVSELGEADIPFQVQVRIPTCDTSVGPASDLFHFANLAQTNWAEAKNLLKSEEFRRTLSFYDPKFDNLYSSLLRSGNLSLALEELLSAAHKKKQVEFTCNKSEITYDSPKTLTSDTITITRNTWGYSQLSVSFEGEFLSSERKIIWTDDFDGNKCDYTFAIDPDKLHKGTNMGKIIIDSIRSTLEIPVIVKNSSSDIKARLSRRKMRHMEMKLLSNYLDFRMGRLTMSKLASEEEKILDTLKVFRNETVLDRMLRIWLQLRNSRESQAITALSIIFEDQDWGDDLILYAMALYLKAETEHEQRESEYSLRLRDLYERSLDARVFLMYMHLDKRGRMSNNIRFDSLRKAVRAGQTSPIVLMEAMDIVNEEPTVLREFDGFDLMVVRYGIRYHIINRNAIMQVAYIASRERRTSPIMIETLLRAAEMFHTNEVVEALCIHLIKGKRYDKTAFKWMSIGISEQLPIKNLYENCLIASMSCPGEALPKGIQGYFEDGIELPDDIKASFYAETLRRKSGVDAISPMLWQQIKEFTLSKLKEGSISDNLVVLYNLALDASDLDDAAIRALPDIVFKHKVNIEWDRTFTILVAHKELKNELCFPVTDGEAFVDIFTEEPDILAEDEQGNRIVPSDYTVQRMITNSALVTTCLSRCLDDERVVLNSIETARYRGDTEEAISLIRNCVDYDDLDTKFSIECRRELIEYYYENLEGELMEDLLVRTDLSALSRRDRTRMIDLMILRELYSLAAKNMELYGSFGVDVKRIAKLTSRLIETGDERVGTPAFTALCMTVLRKKKQDNRIISALVKSYNGDTESMYTLWQAAGEAGINADDLEERLLAQILFTENDMTYVPNIFKHYYSHGGNRRIIRAFLSFYAYKYLVMENVPDEELLDLMRRESVYEENDICTLAVLKNLSQQKTFSDPDRSYIEHRMSVLERKGIIMPFFRNFKDGITIPEGMRDRQYVEYHTDRHKRVRIHYCMMNGGDDSFTETDMKDLGFGIFVSEFVLFYGEKLQYYITEEDDNGGFSITESSELSIEPELIGNEDNGYRQLNLIITAREMNDSKTMQRLLENYIRCEYMSKRLFNPIL